MIDACDKGNYARFINHSCNPNARAEVWTVGDRERVGIFAIKDIKKGKEITYDYNFESYDKNTHSTQKCYCGSKNCRKYIGILKNSDEKEEEENTI